MSTQFELTERAAEDVGAVDAGLGLNPLVGFGAIDLITAYRQIAALVQRHPSVALEYQLDLTRQILQALSGSSALAPARGDRRFADPVWQSNPGYRAVQQSYLAWRDSLDRWVANAGFDTANEQRARITLSRVAASRLKPTPDVPR
jgi:polyhydroxyalkanoate synthase subunit PhaC